MASLNFVDLAGSERASQTNTHGARLREGCHINLSVMTLTTVIRKLSVEKISGHIPYRDSKLTRILQNSLGEVLVLRLYALKPRFKPFGTVEKNSFLCYLSKRNQKREKLGSPSQAVKDLRFIWS